ncbi:hypothetical protein [Bacillus velezensis]|uniref:hypothetical protein n=1 Tax=Bacillus velezensis TaxID=492670 RepID=UPI001EEAF1D9|nr:hypothetical protein [Bacillus velezensis]
MADKRESTDFIVDEKGNPEDIRKTKTRIKLTDKHFAKLPDGKDSVWATDEFSFDEAEKSLRKETVDTGGINVKVNVEVSEAITGLKALQREAKAATQALAELREEQAKGPYKGYIAGERLDGKKLVWLDEGEKIVPLQDGTRSNRKGDR